MEGKTLDEILAMESRRDQSMFVGPNALGPRRPAPAGPPRADPGQPIQLELRTPGPPHGSQHGVTYVATAEVASPDSGEHVSSLELDFSFQGYIAETEHRGIKLRQLQRIEAFARLNCKFWRDTAPPQYSKTSGQELSMDFLNLYHMNTWVILPATRKSNCAFVECLSGSRQTPQWFISHWWGEPIATFLACVELHAKVRGLADSAPFWVCAYANRQHSLGEEVVADPRQTSFFKAMRLADGVLLILDEHGPGTAITRIWCMFEESVALLPDAEREERLLLDIATTVGSEASLLTDGLAKMDKRAFEPSAAKAEREKNFPIDVFKAGLGVVIQDAQASVEDDRVHILNSIAGRDLEDRPPLPSHPAYTRVSNKLRATFAAAAWPKALELGRVEELGLPGVLVADRDRDALILDFSCSRAMADGALGVLAESLPRDLASLQLNLDGCCFLRDEGLTCLARALPAGLRSLTLALNAITSASATCLATLAARLPPGLRELDLSFQSCPQVGDPLVALLAAQAPASLERLRLDLQGCSKVGDGGVAAVAAKLPASLARLEFSFMFCKAVTDAAVAAVRLGLPPGLAKLTLHLTRTGVSKEKLEMCKDIAAFRQWTPSPEEAAAPATAMELPETLKPRPPAAADAQPLGRAPEGDMPSGIRRAATPPSPRRACRCFGHRRREAGGEPGEGRGESGARASVPRE